VSGDVLVLVLVASISSRSAAVSYSSWEGSVSNGGLILSARYSDSATNVVAPPLAT
jgi:hypothetical protein